MRIVKGYATITTVTNIEFEVKVPDHVTEDELQEALELGANDGVYEMEEGYWDTHLCGTCDRLTDEEYMEIEYLVHGKDDYVDEASVTITEGF